MPPTVRTYARFFLIPQFVGMEEGIEGSAWTITNKDHEGVIEHRVLIEITFSDIHLIFKNQ